MSDLPDAIILCGGAGLRLRSVIGDAPKGMAEVVGRPFLELLLQQLQSWGFQRLILAVGYQREAIRAYFGDSAHGLSINYSDEGAPLGTGGALRNALDLIVSNRVLIMNGDSYTDVDLRAFVSDHESSGAEGAVVVVSADGRDDCGTVSVDSNWQLTGFLEKDGSAEALYINAGIYLISRPMLTEIQPGVQISLEKELFPGWIAQGRELRAFMSRGTCVDIGTPERYRVAQALLAKFMAAPITAGGQRG